MLKKRMSGGGCPRDLLHHLAARSGPAPGSGRPSGRPWFGGGAFVALRRRVVPSRLQVVLHPVVRRRTADEVESVLVEIEQDGVADHVAVVVAGDELFRLIDLEVLEAVDAEIREELQRVGALDVEVGHVVRLVEQRAALAPRALLVAPVRELGPNHRKGIGPDLRIAQQVDRALRTFQGGLQAVVGHGGRGL